MKKKETKKSKRNKMKIHIEIIVKGGYERKEMSGSNKKYDDEIEGYDCNGKGNEI